MYPYSINPYYPTAQTQTTCSMTFAPQPKVQRAFLTALTQKKLHGVTKEGEIIGSVASLQRTRSIEWAIGRFAPVLHRSPDQRAGVVSELVYPQARVAMCGSS